MSSQEDSGFVSEKRTPLPDTVDLSPSRTTTLLPGSGAVNSSPSRSTALLPDSGAVNSSPSNSTTLLPDTVDLSPSKSTTLLPGTAGSSSTPPKRTQLMVTESAPATYSREGCDGDNSSEQSAEGCDGDNSSEKSVEGYDRDNSSEQLAEGCDGDNSSEQSAEGCGGVKAVYPNQQEVSTHDDNKERKEGNEERRKGNKMTSKRIEQIIDFDSILRITVEHGDKAKSAAQCGSQSAPELGSLEEIPGEFVTLTRERRARSLDETPCGSGNSPTLSLDSYLNRSLDKIKQRDRIVIENKGINQKETPQKAKRNCYVSSKQSFQPPSLRSGDLGGEIDFSPTSPGTASTSPGGTSSTSTESPVVSDKSTATQHLKLAQSPTSSSTSTRRRSERLQKRALARPSFQKTYKTKKPASSTLGNTSSLERRVTHLEDSSLDRRVAQLEKIVKGLVDRVSKISTELPPSFTFNPYRLLRCSDLDELTNLEHPHNWVRIRQKHRGHTTPLPTML
eukprot:sb/3464008/